jgi:hypothetical protein
MANGGFGLVRATEKVIMGGSNNICKVNTWKKLGSDSKLTNQCLKLYRRVWPVKKMILKEKQP